MCRNSTTFANPIRGSRIQILYPRVSSKWIIEIVAHNRGFSMLVDRRSSTRFIAFGCAAMSVALLGVGVGCNRTDNAPQGTTTTFYGLSADSSSVPGTIELSGVSYPPTLATLDNVPPPGPNAFPLGGTLSIPGQAPLTLTGYYDPDTYVIVFGCFVPPYVFSGSVNGNQATGYSTGPNGQGSFVLVVNGTASSSTTYCGKASCDTPNGCTATGSFNLVVSGQVALMTATSGGYSGFGVGSMKGSAVSFDIVYQDSLNLTINGQIVGSTVSGRWVDNTASAQAGPWSGDTASCTAAPGLMRKR
jgi:hypothetical protein